MWKNGSEGKVPNWCPHTIQAQWHTSVTPELDRKRDRWIPGAL